VPARTLVEILADAPFEIACADCASAPFTGGLLPGYSASRVDASAQIVASGL